MVTALLDEETTKKVIRQVEFYFSDSNLPRDKFLKKTIDDSEDCMVSLSLICSFSRMRNYLSLGSAKPEDVSDDTVQAVADALRKSTFLKISEDGKKIGRTTELLKPDEVIEQLDSRTIAASPLEYDAKLEDVELFFGQFAKVNSVRLPRHVADKKLLCGTALIEFSTEEDAENLLNQSLLYAGIELEFKPKKDYDVERAKEEAEEKEKRSPVMGENRKDSAEPNYPQGLIVAFSLKSKLAGGSSEQISGNEPAMENGSICRSEGEPDSIIDAIEEAKAKVSEEVKGDGGKPGSVIEEESEEKPCDSIQEGAEKADEKTGVESGEKETENGENLESPIKEDEDTPEGEEKTTPITYKDNKDVVLREDLKAVFGKYGSVKFVDFKFGSETGYIRFEEPGAAKKARAAAALAEEGGLVVKNYIATLDPVTGEAEREYWSLLRCNQDRLRERFGNRGRGGRPNRGRHFNAKHSRSRENDSVSRPNKFQKVGAA